MSKSLIKKAGIIVSACICLLLLATSIVYFISFSKDNQQALDIAFASLYLAMLFLPLYGYFLSFLSEKARPAARYITAAIFTARLIVVALLINYAVSNYEGIQKDVQYALNLSASKSEVTQLIRLMESGQWNEFEFMFNQITSSGRRINYMPIIAKNFELAVSRHEIVADEPVEPLIESMFIQLDYLGTIDTVKASIDQYEKSYLSDFIPEQSMSQLLAGYGKWFLDIDSLLLGEQFFAMAESVDPANEEPVLSHADALYENHYREMAAGKYQEYMRLMGDLGRDREIPSRVRKFIRSENYGSSLQKKIYECWLTDEWNEIHEEYWDSYETRDDYLRIGNRFYTAIWGGSHLAYELSACLGKIMGKSEAEEASDLYYLAEFTGIAPEIKELPFTGVNPEIIEWSQKNLIPDPSLSLLDHPCQQFYDVILQQSCRHKALGYAFLNTVFEVDAEAARYQRLMYDEDFTGHTYLWELVSEPASRVYRYDAESWILQEETGFWLRRWIDGSYDACWNALEKILKTYDDDWHQTLWSGWIIHDNFEK